MRPADNIEKIVKKLDFKAGVEMNDRILADALKAQAESKKTKSANLQPNTWRIIMKSNITKLATAAVVILTVVLTVTFLDKSVTPAYAIEQTIEAFENVDSVYYTSTIYEQDSPICHLKTWAKRGADGRFFNGDIREESDKVQTTVAISRENVTYIYTSDNNTVLIYDGITYTTGSWLDMDFYQKIKEWAKEWEQIYVKDKETGKDCVEVSFVVPEDDRGTGKAGKILFDRNSKLPVRMKLWKNRDFKGPPFVTYDKITYNPEIPKGTFDFEIPEGATVIDEKQD